ncbi:MAG: redoxin domain-containing protein [Myxococcales bacterium]|nr:redoxin domain-containing protein [Myxococcales bacterium]
MVRVDLSISLKRSVSGVALIAACGFVVGACAQPQAGPATAPRFPADVRPPAAVHDVSAGELPTAATADADSAAVQPDAVADSAEVSGPPPGANVHLHVTGNLGLQTGTLTVVLVEPHLIAATALGSAPSNLVAFAGPLPTLPLDLWFKAPPATLAALALLRGADGTPLAGGLSCHGKEMHVETFGAWPGPPLDMEVALLPMSDKGITPMAFCAGAVSAKAKGTLTELLDVVTPASKDGGAHFMASLVWGQRLWVAGSQDGFVSFDFPAAAAAAPGPLQGWKIHGEPLCNRMERVGNRLYCASRKNYVTVLTADPTSQAKLSAVQRVFGQKTCTEGLAAFGSTLVVAAHGEGLKALDTKQPHDVLPLASPAELGDAWDARPFGIKRLAVADGAGGLHVYDATATPNLTLKPLGHLPLAGVAAFLHVEGPLVFVSSLGGGLHVVDAAVPAQMKLKTTFQFPGATHGVTVQDGLAIVAGGHHLFAVDVLTAGTVGTVGKAIGRGALATKHFALDVDRFGNDVLTAEFLSVRRVAVSTSFAAGPVLVAPSAVFAPVAVAGGKLRTTLRLHNAGATPLHVTGITLIDEGGNQKVPGAWQIAPHESVAVPIEVAKVQKGNPIHLLNVQSDDPALPETTVPFEETTWLQPGDPFPSGLKYQDATGKTWKVDEVLAGKVGVVIVAAQSCPVAFLALASAAADLAKAIKSGKVGVVALNPWDTPQQTMETNGPQLSFPVLYTPLTTKDGHDWSEVLDVLLGQPIPWGPPMPIVYVVGKNGKIRLAQWGWEPGAVLDVIAEALKE